MSRGSPGYRMSVIQGCATFGEDGGSDAKEFVLQLLETGTFVIRWEDVDPSKDVE